MKKNCLNRFVSFTTCLNLFFTANLSTINASSGEKESTNVTTVEESVLGNSIEISSLPGVEEKELPKITFGTWLMSDEKNIEECINKAILCGIRRFDTAQMYQNEKYVGNAIKKCIDQGLVNREELIITTKIIKYESEDQIRRDIEDSFSNLQVDYIDQFLIHEVPDNIENLKMILKILCEYKRNGKIKHIGISNLGTMHVFDFSKHKDLLSQLKEEVDILQNPFFPGIVCFYGEKGYGIEAICAGPNMLDWVASFEAYKPLGHGKLIKNETVMKIAKDCGVSSAVICLQYCIQKGCIPVFNSTKPEHIQEIVEGLKKVRDLTDEELKILDNLISIADYCDILGIRIWS